MKSKIFIFAYILTTSISIYSYGQNSFLQQVVGQKVEIYFVINKTTLIQIDSLNTDFIKQTWIKKIEIIKNEKYKNIYGNTGGKLFVYPKKKI